MATDSESDAHEEQILDTGNCNRTNPSVAWQHFTVKDKENKLAVCNICQTTFSYKTSVSNLTKHLKRKHFIDNLVPLVQKQAAPDITRNCDDDDSEDYVPEDDGKPQNIGFSEKNKKRKYSSPLWSFFGKVDNEQWIAKCVICSKLLSYKTSISNLKKHLDRQHPNVAVAVGEGDSDDVSKIILSTGDKLYELDSSFMKQETVDPVDSSDEMDRTDIHTEEVYLEEAESEIHTAKKKRQSLKKAKERKSSRNIMEISDSESDMEFRQRKKTRTDAIDHFGKYITSLLKELPVRVSNKLQMDFVTQIMNAKNDCANNDKRFSVATSNGTQVAVSVQRCNGTVEEQLVQHESEVLEDVLASSDRVNE